MSGIKVDKQNEPKSGNVVDISQQITQDIDGKLPGASVAQIEMGSHAGTLRLAEAIAGANRNTLGMVDNLHPIVMDNFGGSELKTAA